MNESTAKSAAHPRAEQRLARRQVTSTNVCTMQLKKWSGRFLRHPHATKRDPIQPRLGNFPGPIEPLQKTGYQETWSTIFLQPQIRAFMKHIKVT